MEKLFSVLKDYLPPSLELSRGLIEFLESKLREKTFRKNEIVLREGQVCRNIYFVFKGVTSVIAIKEKGDDYRRWLQCEDEFVIAVESFFNQTASTERIVAEEALTVLFITFDELQAACETWSEFALVRGNIAQKYYCRSVEWDNWVISASVRDRIRKFFKEQADLARRVSGRVISSYLRMDYATFKRNKDALWNDD
jgi:CRP/FNR family transcriptional regulator, anaerobic regulatory protein